ncbi:MAG: hypothetical protein WDO71_23655 [Bacteroidota bacterium]
MKAILKQHTPPEIIPRILPTDTQKNTVYALAKEHFTSSIEAFGLALSQHFQSNNPQVTQTKVEIIEFCWQRMIIDEIAHAHSFINGGSEKHRTTITQTNTTTSVTSGYKRPADIKNNRFRFC